jgi:hypothetical protein
MQVFNMQGKGEVREKVGRQRSIFQTGAVVCEHTKGDCFSALREFGTWISLYQSTVLHRAPPMLRYFSSARWFEVFMPPRLCTNPVGAYSCWMKRTPCQPTRIVPGAGQTLMMQPWRPWALLVMSSKWKLYMVGHE